MSSDPHVGRVLGGRYRVVRRLRAGGMGAVYEAVQENLGRRVALKLLTYAASPDAIARFRIEAEAAARLGNPHIVQVSDFGGGGGDPPFLVMELLEGRSLGDLVAAEAPLPWRRVARIAMQILAALDAAHAAKIVHRDIKPDNVFLVASLAVPDMVKVLDFGVAKLLDPDEAPLTTEGVAVGTLAYMAPEQVRGMPVDARTDVHAVGMCLYEAVTKRLPYEANNLVALRVAIASDRPVPVRERAPELDARFADVVDRALAKDAAGRFPTARAMADALAACLDEPIAPPPPTLPETVREPARTTAGVVTTVASTEVMPPLAPRTPPSAPVRRLPATLPTPMPPRAPIARPRSGWNFEVIAMIALGAAGVVGVVTMIFSTGVLSQVTRRPATTAEPAVNPSPASTTRDMPTWFDPWEATMESLGPGWSVRKRVPTQPYTPSDPFVYAFVLEHDGKTALVTLYDHPAGSEAQAHAQAVTARASGMAVDEHGLRVVVVLVKDDPATAASVLARIRP